MPEIPDKLHFKIGEVAQITGVKAHVLRYWETEFSLLRPQKTRSNQRIYRRKDVETLLLIKRLLYKEGFTISGANKRLWELNREGAGGNEAVDELIDEIRAKVKEIVALLDADE